MCRSKAEGGRRCLTHIRKDVRRLEGDKLYWEAEIDRRQDLVNQRDNYENRRNLARAVRKATWAETLLDALLIQQAEAEKRAEQTRTVTFTTTASVALNDGELASVKAAARSYEQSVNAYIRNRLEFPPFLNDYPTGVITRQAKKQGVITGEQKGRNATQGRVGEYHRKPLTFKVTAEQKEQVVKEADLFKVSVSDYIRAVLFDIDPRAIGFHRADEFVEHSSGRLATQEREAGVSTGSGAKEYWTARVREIREEIARSA